MKKETNIDTSISGESVEIIMKRVKRQLMEHERLKVLKENINNQEIPTLLYLKSIDNFPITNKMEQEYLKERYGEDYQISEISLTDEIRLYRKDRIRSRCSSNGFSFKVAHNPNIKPITYNISNFLMAIYHGEITFVGDYIIETSNNQLIYPIALSMYHNLCSPNEYVYDEFFVEFIRKNYVEAIIDKKIKEYYKRILTIRKELNNEVNTIIEVSNETNEYLRTLKIERST